LPYRGETNGYQPGRNERFCAKGSVPSLSAKRDDLNELVRHLEILEQRAAAETVPSIRAAWEDQAEAVRALIGGLIER
jgi:hypothetical protein